MYYNNFVLNTDALQSDAFNFTELRMDCMDEDVEISEDTQTSVSNSLKEQQNGRYIEHDQLNQSIEYWHNYFQMKKIHR